MKRIYLKEFKDHLIDASRKDLSHSEKLDLSLRRANGYDVYRYLHSLITRDQWIDHPGFPLKKEFYNNKLLACTVSIRKIASFFGFGNQKIQKISKTMETLHWTEHNNQYTWQGQTVYILGTWEFIENKDGELVRAEKLFRDFEREKYIKQKRKKTEENDYSMYNFEAPVEDDRLKIRL